MAKKISPGRKAAVKRVVKPRYTKKESKYIAWAMEHLEENRGDTFMNLDAFNAHNAQTLMVLEIHDLLEKGVIDFVHEDNSHSPEHGGKGVKIFQLPDDQGKVLMLPYDIQYDEWRAFYDSIVEGEIPDSALIPSIKSAADDENKPE